MPLVEMKEFNVLINNKPCKTEEHIEMLRNNDYTIIQQETYFTKKLNYLHHQNYYKLIGIDLLWQLNTSIPQQINFTGRLEEYFYCWKAAKNYSKLFFWFINNGTSKNIKFIEWCKHF